MDWRDTFEECFGLNVKSQHWLYAVVQIYEHVLSPLIRIDDDRLHFPDNFTLKIGGSAILYQLFSNKALFTSLPLELQKTILDVSILILNRSIYDVSRFRCCECDDNTVVEILFDLLSCGDIHDIGIGKRIIRLIGLVCTGGVSPPDLKSFLSLLKVPSEFSISLLQVLKSILNVDNGIVKASPPSFFNFGGCELGIRIDPFRFPFQREYQIMLWARIEHCEQTEAHDQRIVTFGYSSPCLDVFLRDRVLHVSVTSQAGETVVVHCDDFPLYPAVWYHVCITHTKPRISMFGRSELSVHIDHQLVCQEAVPFPHCDSSTCDTSLGSYFNGQIGPIYLLSEVVQQSTVQVIARQDAGRYNDQFPFASSPDLVPLITTPDKKSTSLSGKLLSVYHPLRCSDGVAIDVHNNRNGSLSPKTRVWHVYSVRNALISLGGISCLLPLFPKLLIENEDIRQSVIKQYGVGSGKAIWEVIDDGMSLTAQRRQLPAMQFTNVGLGTSIIEVLCEDDILNVLDVKTIQALVCDKDEFQEDKPIALLLFIIAGCVNQHRVNRNDFFRLGGVDMVEYILTGMPLGAYILKEEDESCILALLKLRSATQDFPPLEAAVTKQLLCNFKIWSCASFSLQSSLYSVILASLQAQTEAFMGVIGVQLILDSVSTYYLDSVGNSTQTDIIDSKEGEAGRTVTLDKKTRSASRSSASFKQSVNRRMSEIDINAALSAGVESTSEQVVSGSSGPVPCQSRVPLVREISRKTSCHFDSSQRFVDCTDSDDSETESGSQVTEDNSKKMELSDDINQDNPVTKLTACQRKSLRDSLFSMVMVMVFNGLNVSQIRPIYYFTSTCMDHVVLEEVIQLLLCLIVKEQGRKIVNALTEVARGIESFGSYVLTNFINHSYEHLRCSAIALLTHYYLRVEVLAPALLNVYARRKFSLKLAKAREKYASMAEGQGLELLRMCGGMSLLCHYLGSEKVNATDMTYTALLDMLLTTTTSETQISSSALNIFSIGCSSSSGRTLLQSKGSDTLLRRIDESSEIQNPAALKAFFHLIPDMSNSIRDRVYQDLLALIKHNSRNRDIFCSDPAWQLCMYKLVEHLVTVSENISAGILQRNVPRILEAWAIYESPENEDVISSLFANKEIFKLSSFGIPRQDGISRLAVPPGSPSTSGWRDRNIVTDNYDAGLDMYFDIGMKVYATLLLHTLDCRCGSREIDNVLSLTFESEHDIAVSYAVLSHLLNEITFTMQSKYKDVQRMLNSASDEENNEARIRLENMLSVIWTLSSFFMLKHCVAGLGIKNLSLGKRRFKHFLDIVAEKNDLSSCEQMCSCNEREQSSMSELCEQCGCKVPLDRFMLPMAIADERLRVELNSDDSENLTQVIENESISEHIWVDVLKDSDIIMEPMQQRGHRGKSKLADSEILASLQRGYELPKGRMIVVLQLLRYFDFVFLPGETRLRNGHMLTFAPGNYKQDFQSVQQKYTMTLYSTMLRLCLFTLHELSPFNEYASLNVRRLVQLIKVIEKGPAENCSRDDWTLVVLTHIVMAVNRVYVALAPVYGALGMQSKEDVVFDGPIPHPHAELRRHEEDYDDFESVMDNPDIPAKVNDMLNNSAGRHLVQYANNCIDLLVTLYNTRKNFLASVMGDRAFMAYTLLVQRHQNVNIKITSLKRSFAVARVRSMSNHSGGNSPTMFSPDDYTIYSRGNSGISVENTQSPELSRTDDKTLRSNYTSADDESDIKFCEEALLALRWLRDPFTRINLLYSEKIIESIMSVESIEDNHNDYFHGRLKAVKADLLVHEDENDYIDEANDLRELGSDTFKYARDEEIARIHHRDIVAEVHLKSSAVHWNNCLRDLEEDWSPWSPELEHFEAQYARSNHRDNSLRRLLMRRLDENVDHSDAAYFESRVRDEPSDSMRNENGLDAKVTPVATSFLQNTLQFTRPKMSRLKSAMDWDENESEEEAEAEETSVNVSTRVDKGLVLFSSQQTEKIPLWALAFNWLPDEKEILTADVTKVMTEQILAGTILLTNKYLYFHPKKRVGGFSVRLDEFRNRRWKLDRLVECYGRRYLLQNSGVELFFADCPEIFLAFNSPGELHRFFRHLRKQNVPLLMTGPSLNPTHIFQRLPWTELWKKRQISNFEYLMRLNIIAGRSYNDITQYPVLPWILSDYESDVLDLTDENIFRDLRKPIGALNDSRLSEILDRYKSFGDSDMPSFMYGSHYSSAGVVLHFLIRQEPFTSMAITLQGGRFDCPDRLFFDIKSTWQCCNTSVSDVKELIPEMFYLPELFINSNNLPLGELQDDRGTVDNVKLPPWCHNDPFEFIRLNREALESDYVSDNLHHWIDLIFGYKQTGQPAIDACNVFHYLTYENAIDIEAIQDPLQKNATKAQVTHFGQTPSQLLTKAHPKRYPKEECISSFCNSPNMDVISKARCYTPPKQFVFNGEHGAIVAVECCTDRLIAFYEDFSVVYYKWNGFPDTEAIPFQLKQDRVKKLPSVKFSIFRFNSISSNDDVMNDKIDSSSPSYFEGLIGITREKSHSNANRRKEDAKAIRSTGEDEVVPSFSVSAESVRERSRVSISKGNIVLRMSDGGIDRIISCGYWDFNLKVHSLDSMREIGNTNGNHIGAITCVDMGSEKHILVTGGSDCTCRVWVIDNPVMASALSITMENVNITDMDTAENLMCIHVLWGHDSPVTAISYSSHHDLVFSGSENGLLCLHSARRGRYIRSIYSMTQWDSARKSHSGLPISVVGISSAGYLVAHASSNLETCVFWINGQLLHRICVPCRIECLTMSRSGTVIFFGGSNGVVTARKVWDLGELWSFHVEGHGSVTALTLALDDQFLLIGSESGTLHVCTDPDARWKTLHSAILKNPLMGSAL